MHTDDECSGHGHLVDGACSCDNPWPEPKASGWTGPQCAIPVFGSAADPLSGTDMTQWCHDAGCHKLQPGGWVCFAAHAPFK